MILVKNPQAWDKHTDMNYIYLDENTLDVIGSFQLSFVDKDYLVSPYFNLSSVYIQSAYRGKGYANKMMDDMIALTNGVDYVWLKVRRDNTEAISLYDKYGFVFHSQDVDPNYVWMEKGNKQNEE